MRSPNEALSDDEEAATDVRRHCMGREEAGQPHGGCKRRATAFAFIGVHWRFRVRPSGFARRVLLVSRPPGPGFTANVALTVTLHRATFFPASTYVTPLGRRSDSG